MNFGSVPSDRVKLLGGEGGLIFGTNCIFGYKASPHFRLDIVYKMGGGGGVLTGDTTVHKCWPVNAVGAVIFAIMRSQTMKSVHHLYMASVPCTYVFMYVC